MLNGVITLLFPALVAAALPTLLYTLVLWWLDRYEKEPLHLLAIVFLWGAAPAVILTLVVEFAVAAPLSRALLGPIATYVWIAPPIEESMKAMALLGLFRWARSEFDGPLDGIIYGALIGFGFSMTENLLYFLAYRDLGWMVVVRGLVFGLNHALFSSIVGLALGWTRYRQGRWQRIGVFLLGLLIAILFHAVHNALVGMADGGMFFSWVIQSSGVLVVLAVAVLAWRHEHQWLMTELEDEVERGLLSYYEYEEVISATRRVERQWRALREGGWRAFQQVRRWHHLLTLLAFRKSQLRLADPHHRPNTPDTLRQELQGLRLELFQH